MKQHHPPGSPRAVVAHASQAGLLCGHGTGAIARGKAPVSRLVGLVGIAVAAPSPLVAMGFAPLVATLMLAAGAQAAQGGDVLIATRTLRAATPIGEGDVALVQGRVPPGAATDPAQAVGMEARVTLYAGRPIPLASLAPPAMVERNQIVQLVYQHAGLDIRAEGRALGRAGEGESVRVMNLASRSTVTGRVEAAGIVTVAP